MAPSSAPWASTVRTTGWTTSWPRPGPEAGGCSAGPARNASPLAHTRAAAGQPFTQVLLTQKHKYNIVYQSELLFSLLLARGDICRYGGYVLAAVSTDITEGKDRQ